MTSFKHPLEPAFPKIAALIGGGLLAVAAFATPSTTSAQTVVEFHPPGFSTTDFPGQSVTIPAGGPFENISFNFFSGPGESFAAGGTLFLLNQAYGGTPAGLSAATPGFLASSIGITGGVYLFDPGVSLLSGSTYFFYSNASFSFLSNQIGGAPGQRGFLTGDGFFFAPGGAINDFRLSSGLTLIDLGPTSLQNGFIIEEILLVDRPAIESLLQSGLPMALSLREICRATQSTILRDVNGRLFRLRSGTAFPGPSGTAGPTGDEKMVIEHHGKEIELPRTEPYRRYELFATGDFGNTDRDDINDAVGFNQDIWAATLGFEYRLCREALWGLAGTYVGSDADLGQKIGSVDTDGFALTTYLSAYWKKLYFDALYSYSRLEHDLRRNTFFGGTAHASPESETHSVFLNLGYNLELGRVVTGPFAALEYANSDLEAYAETGPRRFKSEVNAQNFDSLISRIGWQASFPMQTSFGSVTPQIRGSWIHRYLDDDETVGATLAQSPFVLVNAGGARRVGGFSTSGKTEAAGRDALSIGAGVTTRFGDRFSVLLDYEVQFLQKDNLQQFASVRGSIAF